MDISVSLISELIKAQFPHWANLAIRPVEFSGIDNKTFRLGENMLIRMPSSQNYAPQVLKEQKLLPLLAPYLTLSIPKPVALGQASTHYPWQWSIYQWLEGESANSLSLSDRTLTDVALDLAQFLNELHTIDSIGGPLPGPHNYWRGEHPSVYDLEARVALKELTQLIDTRQAIALWETAIASHWKRNPVWIHGDLASGNILINEGKLSAIIDFGCMGIGDPACDLVIAWTFLNKESRQVFKKHLDLDENTWARARGWALWKASITLAALDNKMSIDGEKQRQLIQALLDEHAILSKY